MAHEGIRKLKHSDTVHDYVKKFSALLLDVKDMSNDDKLFNFMARLQSWAQAELRRQGVKDITQAIIAADTLADYKTSFSSPDLLRRIMINKSLISRKRNKRLSLVKLLIWEMSPRSLLLDAFCV